MRTVHGLESYPSDVGPSIVALGAFDGLHLADRAMLGPAGGPRQARAASGRAARSLGRPYSVAGPVTRGAGRGGTLGFPTANLDPERPLLLPTGVYAGRAEIDGATHQAVVNVGVRPTFGENALAIEAYLMDVAADFYGRPLRLHFMARLRGERKFAGVDELRAQIARDVET